MAKWTTAQSEAINARNANLLIAAAAGSGKTAVLVERILTLVIEDGIGIDHMLIVTFSNAAAGEMRERIMKALSDAVKTRPEHAKFLRQQIHKVGKAYIMTLHAFCNDVLRKHYIEIGIDPSFKIGETSTLDLMKQEAVDLCLAKAYEESDEAFTYLVESYSANRSDKKLSDLIQKIHGFIQAQPEPFSWLEDSVQAMGVEASKFDEMPATKALMKYIAIELEGIYHLAQMGLDLCYEPEGPYEYEANFKNDLEQLEAIQLAMENGYEIAMKAMEAMTFSRLVSIKKERKMEISERCLEDAKRARDHVKKKLAEFKNRYFTKSVAEILEELHFLKDKMARLSELVVDYDNQYRALKLEKNLIDFNDLEHYALRILENPNLSALYREQFDYIFLDEYQDANIVQETLINRIKRSDNVFLVGDVKQSIYKFRLADPSLFLDKHSRYSQAATAVDRRIDLSMNFRTRGEILGFVNDFFTSIMQKDLGEIDYDQTQYLYNGMTFPKAEMPSVTLDILDLGDQDEQEEEDIQYMKSAELEAHHIAGRIQKAIGKPIYDPKQACYKNLKYSDIVILLRSTRETANLFNEILTQWRIPVYVDVGSSFFEALEINMTLSLLRIIDNRYRDLAWMTVLRSPFVGLDLEEMALIRSTCQEKSYFEAILYYCETTEDILSNKLKAFMKNLDRWTSLSTHMRLDEWLWRLFDETQFYAYCGAMPDGANRQANLRMLTERAAALEGQSESGLYQFIKVIERLEKSGGDLEAAKLMPEQEDAVRIMSIHKSKGLEFPLVIIAGLNKRFNLSDTYEDVMLHKTLGIAPKFVTWQERHYRFTFNQLAMRKQMTNEMLSEEMRILYVALTRPVDQMWLVGSVSQWDSSFKRWRMGPKRFNLMGAKSYLDWLGMYLMDTDYETCDPEQSQWLIRRHESQSHEAKMSPRFSNCQVNRYKVADIAMSRLAKEEETYEWQDWLGQTLGETFEKTVPSDLEEPLRNLLTLSEETLESPSVPSKISVTALKRHQETGLLKVPMDTDLGMPNWQLISGEVTAAARGSAFHKCLQYLRYKVAEEWQAEALKAHLVKMKVLSQAEAESIPLQWIEAYKNSSMYERISKADKCYKEYPFVLKIELENQKTLLQGIIDLCFEEGDRLILADFKTDYLKSEKDIPEAIARHSVQLSWYGKAMAITHGREPDEVWLYFSSLQKWVLVE